MPSRLGPQKLLLDDNVAGLRALGIWPVWPRLAVLEAGGALARLGCRDGRQAQLVIWPQARARARACARACDGVQYAGVVVRTASLGLRALLLAVFAGVSAGPSAVAVAVYSVAGVGTVAPQVSSGAQEAREAASVESPDEQGAERGQTAGDDADGGLDAGPDEDVAFGPADILGFGEVDDNLDTDDGRDADTKTRNNI